MFAILGRYVNKHKHRSTRRRGASLDGMLPSSGTLGGRPSVYRPNQGSETPSLGDYIHRSDGFHPTRNTDSPVGTPLNSKLSPEEVETQQLNDDPIVIDDDFSKKDKGAKPSRRKRIVRGIKRTLLGLLILALLVGGFLGWKFQHNISKVFHGNIFSLLHTTKLKGEDQGRVTILLAGNSADDVGHNGGQLTDSIMLISIDTVHNAGYLMSIPRDLWVNFGTTDCSLGNSGKINAVYECGQETKFSQSNYPNGGMGLLEKVVNQDFGVNINYYALINYSALRDSVNAIGGVNFTVNVTDGCGKLYDGNRDYTTHGPLVNLTNGSHALIGQQALDLARARGDPPYPSCGFERGDFTRTQNQRQLLLNLKSKILSLGTLSNPAKISSLLDAIGNNVQTDFHVDEIKRLYDLNKKIPNSGLQSIGLADDNVNLVRTGEVGNQSVVIPTAGISNFSQIRSYISKVNSNDPLVKEGATATVLNGSDVAGFASKTATSLTNRGLVVKTVGDTKLHQKTVVVILNPKKTATKSFLEKKFNVTATTNTTANPEAKYYSTDFVIILGTDASSSQ